MADDAIAYDGVVEGKYEQKEFANLYIVVNGAAGGRLTVPLADLPSAKPGDKVQVALFLRPEAGDGE